MRHALVGCKTLLLLTSSLASDVLLGDSPAWNDPSAHVVRTIEVEAGVRLETLDWGGRGRPVVLLAGGGNTAHVFDDFAPKLTTRYRVYGITRRGSPPSSVPDDGYSADRMGDDILAVIRALKLNRPVLVGHSFAGNEISNVASRHPELIAGAIYLDASHTQDSQYEAEGFYKIVPWKNQLNEFHRKLEELIGEPFDSRPLARAMLQTNLPQLQAILETLIKIEDGRPPRPAATSADLVDFRAVQTWYARNARVVIPESEFRAMLTTDEAGRPTSQFRRPRFVGQKLEDGMQKYTDIRTPALGIFAVIDDPGSADLSDPRVREDVEAYQWFQRERASRQIAQFQHDLPDARVVKAEHADHYVFLSNEKDVLKEMNAFIASLPRQ